MVAGEVAWAACSSIARTSVCRFPAGVQPSRRGSDETAAGHQRGAWTQSTHPFLIGVQMTEPKNLGRREFVKWSAAGVIVGRAAMQPFGMRRDDRIRGANDRVVVGLIGAGRQGQGDLGNAVKQPDTEVGAVCDVYAPNLAKGLEVAPGAKSYGDFRRVLENKDIDAVIIATPDHWHPVQTILACEAGKDVYVEKPISVSVSEGRAMVTAARRYNRVVQAG